MTPGTLTAPDGRVLPVTAVLYDVAGLTGFCTVSHADAEYLRQHPHASYRLTLANGRHATLLIRHIHSSSLADPPTVRFALVAGWE